MGKAAQDFAPEAYLKYVEGGKSRRTQDIGKRTRYRLKTLAVWQQQSYGLCIGFVNDSTFAQGSFSFGRLFGQYMTGKGLIVDNFSGAGFFKTFGGRTIGLYFGHEFFSFN